MMEHLESNLEREDFRKPLETWETSPNAPELYLKVFGPRWELDS